MSKQKHSGENVAGVTMQMRFIPLKTDPDKQTQLVTILVHVDDTQKGMPDNIRELKLPIITKLELEGETFVLNKVKLINTILFLKGWTQANSLAKRLEKYAMFMMNWAKMDFTICQQKARGKFLKCFKIPNTNQMFDLTSQQNVFLTWLKQPNALKKLGYVSGNPDTDEVEQAYEEAVVDYKRSIMYFTGIKLWSDHRITFREHKKYYGNHLRKPSNMSIINFKVWRVAPLPTSSILKEMQEVC